MKYLLLLVFIVGQQFYNKITAQVLQPNLSEMVTMRDGKQIATDVYLPGNGKYPVILIQTPYNKNLYKISGMPLKVGKNISSSNYAFVIADWRCFFGSKNACNTQNERGKDGYDLIEWIHNQPWSNGKVGTWGPSALGKIQFLTAKEQHPSHICAVPLVAGPQFSYKEYYPGGCLRTEYVEQLDELGFGIGTLVKANPQYNLTWQIAENQSTYYNKIKIPMLLVGGWYDHNADLQIEAFQKLSTESDPLVKEKHRLLMGPWVHGGFRGSGPGSGQAGELSFPLAKGWPDSLAILFFDYYLRDMQNGWDQSPTVQYYRMGKEKWEASSEYPPANIPEMVLFLRDSGILSKQQDMGSQLKFSYNPADPSPTIGGTTLRSDLLQGPYDQAEMVESRNDLITFSSELLENPVNLNGKAQAFIWLSSDRTDTDICLRLTDVYPDGRSMLLCDGVRRMRFRSSFSEPSLMLPETVYEAKIELPVLAHTFLPGHKIRLDVSSSDYPRFDANLNNGGQLYTAGDTLLAEQTLYFSEDYPSRLILPVDNELSSTIDGISGLGINIAPNPFSEIISIKTSQKVHLSIFSITGISCMQVDVSPSESILNLNNLKSGIYLLRITNDKGQSQMTKVVKI